METITKGMLRDLDRAMPYLTPEEKARALSIVQAPTVAPQTFVQYTRTVNPLFQFHPHNLVVAKALQRVADGELKRLIILEPPRHGKSEQVSRLFPGYFLYRHPHQWVGMAAYGQDLAYTFSRAARNYYHRALGEPDDGVAAAVRLWETGKGGGMWAAGIGGTMAGLGYSLGIIDDPVKNAQEAKSIRKQMAHREWYDSVWYTRQAPGAAIVITLTRWDRQDLVGYVLEKEASGEDPERWHIVHLPAIAESGPPKNADGTRYYPVTCTLEPEWRKPGEALAPKRYNLKALAKIRSKITQYFWHALFQQRPTPPEGTMLKRAWFAIIPAIPGKVIARARWWDNASTKDDGDQTAGAMVVKYAKRFTGELRYAIEDVRAGHWSPGKRQLVKQETAAADAKLAPAPIIYEEQEPGSAGKEVAMNAQVSLAGYPVITEPSTGDKETALIPLAMAAELGKVDLIAGAWNEPWLTQATAFPHGDLDDQVEAAGKAFNKVAPAQDMDPGNYKDYRK